MLQTLLEAVRAETGVIEHFRPGDKDPAFRMTKVPAVVGVVNLAEPLPQLTIDPQSPTVAVVEHQAGRMVPLSTAIMQNSRVCQAGARFVAVKDAAKAILDEDPNKPPVAWSRRETHFSVIDGAKFEYVPDESEVSTQPMPFKSVEIALGESASHGVRFEVSRHVLKSRGDEFVEHVVTTGLSVALASLADAVLLKAIKESSPSVFSLGAAAARGLRFGELRGIVGTAGTGAAVDADGVLRLAGVGAELSGETDVSIVGSFARAAVAVQEEIRLIVERTSLAGSLTVTAWVNCQALLPDNTAFFSVAA